MIKLKIKQVLLLVSLLCFLTACNKQQNKAEELVRTYLHGHLLVPNSYKSEGFSDVVKLKDVTLPGAKAPMLAYGRWEIVHKYSYNDENDRLITDTKVFYIDSAFTEASCCYVKLPNAK